MILIKFIKIDDRISDYDDYLKEVSWIKKLVFVDLRDYLTKFGFNLIFKRFNDFKLIFHNKDLDLLLEIKITKKSKEEFV